MRRESSFAFLAAALLGASVASPLGIAPGPASAADSKIDLTSCLAPGAAAGDVRVFQTSQGTRLTETVLDVAGWSGKDGWTATVQAQLAAHEPTVRETFVRPGKSMYLGNLAVGDLSIDVGNPDRWLPLMAVPGRVYSAQLNGKALRNGEKVGSARVEGSWEVIGFEPLTTPGGSYSDTVHIAAERSIAVREAKGGPEQMQESDLEIWCVDGVGIVAASYAFRFFEDGEMVGEVNGLDSWLVSATVEGAAVN